MVCFLKNERNFEPEIFLTRNSLWVVGGVGVGVGGDVGGKQNKVRLIYFAFIAVIPIPSPFQLGFHDEYRKVMAHKHTRRSHVTSGYLACLSTYFCTNRHDLSILSTCLLPLLLLLFPPPHLRSNLHLQLTCRGGGRCRQSCAPLQHRKRGSPVRLIAICRPSSWCLHHALRLAYAGRPRRRRV